MKTAILIPARIESKRFPRKMLSMLGDETLIQRVYRKCEETDFPTFVLTDSAEVVDHMPKGKAFLTADAENGTDRCSWYVNNVFQSYDCIINVQGDMPDITPHIINTVHDQILRGAEVATVYAKMPPEKREVPSVVKVIHNGNKARWFGRGFTRYGDHHLGIYGYTTETLSRYRKLTKYEEESIEKLEQLRWLQNDIEISMAEVVFDGIEINTPHDYLLWKNNNGMKDGNQ